MENMDSLIINNVLLEAKESLTKLAPYIFGRTFKHFNNLFSS